MYPTERDIEIFKLLVRFRYLPSDYIHAFVGGNEKALSRRLNLLSRKPNLYLARPQQQRQNADANYRRLIYQLDERGSRALRERGLSFLSKSYHHNFAHELMVAQITASIELGTRENSNIRLITWPEILANANTPQATRDSPTPAAIRVTIHCAARPVPTKSPPTPGRSALSASSTARAAICSSPASRPIAAPSRSTPATSIDRRSPRSLPPISAIAEQGIYRSHFGFPNFFVPFITTEQRAHALHDGSCSIA